MCQCRVVTSLEKGHRQSERTLSFARVGGVLLTEGPQTPEQTGIDTSSAWSSYNMQTPGGVGQGPGR